MTGRFIGRHALRVAVFLTALAMASAPAQADTKPPKPAPADTKPKPGQADIKPPKFVPVDRKLPKLAPADRRPPQPTWADAKQRKPAQADIKLRPKPVRAEVKPAQPVQVDTELSRPVGTDARPLKPVQVGTKPVRPVRTDVKPLKSVRAEVKPAQPVQVGTKPVRPVRKDVRPPPPAQADTRPSDTKSSDSPPKTIQIPSLALGARIMPVGFDEGRIASPPLSASQRVGWFSMGPKPGATGAAILVGHYDSTTGPAVFYRLSELRPGRLIYVTRKDGLRLRFRVTKKATYPKDSFPGREVYADPGRSELRLITCGGAFDTRTRHYVDNTVVYARLLGKG